MIITATVGALSIKNTTAATVKRILGLQVRPISKTEPDAAMETTNSSIIGRSQRHDGRRSAFGQRRLAA